jgi:pimeloyl-ACP methyl ester carboxylesterase
MENDEILQAPRRSLLLNELRVFIDLATLPLSFIGNGQEPRDFSPVIVLPGFGAGELAMRPLRKFLHRNGFDAEDWGLGINRAGLDIPHQLDDLGPTWPDLPLATYRREGGVAMLVNKMVERVAARSEAAGKPVALVGWSLGGTIAREVARDLPGSVAQVITLGSPLIGGPKYTAAAHRLAKRGLNLDWIEEQVREREKRPVKVPITALVSPSDAIVDSRAARDHYSENVKHIEVNVAHLSMGLNRQVWQLILQTLLKSQNPTSKPTPH